jgi:predicted Zn-dependent peptidase
VDACVRAVFAELPKMKEASYLSDEELANAAYSIEVGLIHERERPSSYAHTITFWWASAGLDYYRGYVDHVKKVTRADIARYLDKFVLGKPFVFGAMVSSDALAPRRHRPRVRPRGLLRDASAGPASSAWAPANASRPARRSSGPGARHGG